MMSLRIRICALTGVAAGFLCLSALANDRNAVEARLRRDVTFLASPECEGRGVETKGINRAADYIAQEFQKIGLKPAGVDGGWFQPFSIAGRVELGSPNRLLLKGPLGQEIELRPGTDFQVSGLSGSGSLTGPVVFLGYGITAKEVGYDEFKDQDLTGKVVVILRKTPRGDNFDGDRTPRHAGLTNKLALAGANKAAAVLFVNDRETAGNNDPLMDFNYAREGSSGTGLPALHVHRDLVDRLMNSSSDQRLANVEAAIDRDLKPRSTPLTGWTATLQTSVKATRIPCKNVIGVVEGKGDLANETVIVGAHYDHLGLGERGTLARNLKGPAIHHGADDNASGTTMMIELARRFAARPDKNRRRLVFMGFSGEERGLLGSEYYVNHPIYPLKDTVAMFNLDMVGRLRPEGSDGKGRDRLIVEGSGTAKDFSDLLDRLNKKYDFALKKVPGGMGPSDQASFYAKGLPVLFFFTGEHVDYHKPSDTADKINVQGMVRIADMGEEIVENFATRQDRPEYVKVATAAPGRPSRSGPRLGVMPAYGEDKEGMQISQVTEGGAAAKAGLQAGDLVVELDGKAVKSVEGYMALMGNYKKGDRIKVTFIRAGKRQVVEVEPQ